MKTPAQTPGSLCKTTSVPTDSDRFTFRVAASVSEWKCFHSLTLAATAHSSRSKI